ncbi:hypothetical protein FQN49_002175 [Arthroderma sp. PD_2]|nr:hypothetical protein FQN49_002175 [Arthroderma sp. PD_2]
MNLLGRFRAARANALGAIKAVAEGKLTPEVSPSPNFNDPPSSKDIDGLILPLQNMENAGPRSKRFKSAIIVAGHVNIVSENLNGIGPNTKGSYPELGHADKHKDINWLALGMVKNDFPALRQALKAAIEEERNAKK